MPSLCRSCAVTSFYHGEKKSLWIFYSSVQLDFTINLINLLQYNETDCKAVRRPNKQELVAFRDKLNKVGLTVKIRESRGGNIKAACGQLVSRLNNRNMSAPKKKGASELDTGSSNNAGSSSRLKPSKRRYVNNKSKNGKKGSSHK